MPRETRAPGLLPVLPCSVGSLGTEGGVWGRGARPSLLSLGRRPFPPTPSWGPPEPCRLWLLHRRRPWRVSSGMGSWRAHLWSAEGHRDFCREHTRLCPFSMAPKAPTLLR